MRTGLLSDRSTAVSHQFGRFMRCNLAAERQAFLHFDASFLLLVRFFQLTSSCSVVCSQRSPTSCTLLKQPDKQECARCESLHGSVPSNSALHRQSSRSIVT